MEQGNSSIDAVESILTTPVDENLPEDKPAGSDDVADQLAAILGHTDAPQADAPADNAGEGAPERSGESLKDINAVAEKLGAPLDDLYAIEVPMPDGENPMTLGELKDAAIEHKRGAVERLEFDEKVQQHNNAIANAREELGVLVRMLPESARTPEMLNAARAEIERVREHNIADLFVRVPSWKDQEAKAADLQVIAPHLENFGFKAGELDQVYDARLLAYIRHNALREQKLADMLSQLKSKRTPNRKTGGPRQVASETKPAGNSGNRRDAVIQGVTSIILDSSK